MYLPDTFPLITIIGDPGALMNVDVGFAVSSGIKASFAGASGCLVPGVQGQHLRTERCRYMGTSLMRNSAPLGPCIRTVPRALWWP